MIGSIRSDERGFALQTAIVMTALIAIAMAVSAVLLTRGGDVVDDLERAKVTRDPSQFSTQVLCEAYGFSWDSVASTCN